MYEEEIHFWKLLLKSCLTPVTLTFAPVTPKSIGFICYTGWLCGPSLRKVCQGVLELLIGIKKVTDRTTDMCKAICISSSKGGIQMVYIYSSLRQELFHLSWEMNFIPQT